MRAQGRSHNLMLIGKNKRKMGKKVLVLFFAFLLSIESFAAVVSDNDGSAFITKAEFDSLKNDFQSQLDGYNTSIDAKIDNAIASYLAGISFSKEEPRTNNFELIELATGQKIRDLKWSNSTNFCLNVCSNETVPGDIQKIYQEIFWYQIDKPTSGSWEKLSGPAIASTKENRIEVAKRKNIIAWGEYAPSCLVQSEIAKPTGTLGDFFAWAPTDYVNFAPAMRKQTEVSQDESYNNVNNYTELNLIKYSEALPSDLQTFNMNMIYIASLSTKKEATLPPAPAASGANFTWVNQSSTTFGENRYATNSSRSNINPCPSGWTRTWGYYGGGSSSYGWGGQFYDNLQARWFRICEYNELSFKVIDDKYGFECPMKCGLPISQKLQLKQGEKIKLKVDNITKSGYFIPYVSTGPDATWGGLKPSWSDSKYRITTGKSFNFEIDIKESKDGYYVFVIWLPDEPAVLPDVDIKKVSGT